LEQIRDLNSPTRVHFARELSSLKSTESSEFFRIAELPLKVSQQRCPVKNPRNFHVMVEITACSVSNMRRQITDAKIFFQPKPAPGSVDVTRPAVACEIFLGFFQNLSGRSNMSVADDSKFFQSFIGTPFFGTKRLKMIQPRSSIIFTPRT